MPTSWPSDETKEDTEWDSALDPAQIILESDSGADEARFELICAELGNKSARRILNQISNGVNTSPRIAENTGLTVQDVLQHLDRLVTAGMIKKSGKLQSLRGRRADVYEISRLAVLLTPAETANRLQLKELVRKKSEVLLKRRLLTASALTGVASASLFAIVYRVLASVSAPIRIGGGFFFGAINNVSSSDALPLALGAAILTAPISFLILWKALLETRPRQGRSD